ncbi:hypothetical protein DOTSEDRAFT_133898 [Dothistroma septosporum NZE10]|uniref:Uncharacterized protein n=1 Tax=Dothistroma septosporum (strain NZE10 / CBS 128990) TaxID=675120 RepID=N1PI51_DOTSN|nr:hypothetical protein DOTSEDRAFT_133898 [Dothistroma septosporum NZE10]
MFSFAQFLAIAAVVLSTATALPTQEKELQLAERATSVPSQVGIYVCNDANWKDCQHLLESPGVCHTLPKDLLKKVSAVGSDDGENHGASGCTLFETQNCGGEYLKDITNPGESDLSKSPAGGRYNDFFQSYVCY